MEMTLNLEKRDLTGKGPNRRLRATGKIPAVIYGQDRDNENVALDPRGVEKALLSEGGRNAVFTTEGAIPGRKVMLKEYQVDPVRRNLLHVDLFEVSATETITITIPINFVGKADGVKNEGGVLNVTHREIEVDCLPGANPEHIDVDVSALKIGDAIHLDDLTLPEGIEKTNTTNPTLVTVVPPTKEEEAEPSLAAAAEPELVGKKGEDKEDEEGSSGEKKDK